MRIWIISDTHFYHQKLVTLGVRPDGFEQLIFRNLLQVEPGDLLIHLGDFAIGREAEAVQAYIGFMPLVKHILVTGNHDNHTASWYMGKGFHLACRSFSGRYFGKHILFSHIPRPLASSIDFNVHGHFHAGDHRSSEPEIKAIYDPKRHIKLALEETNYKPILLEKLIGNHHV